MFYCSCWCTTHHPSSLCNAECLHVGSHYTVSSTFNPSSPNSIWSVRAKNNIKIHVYEMGARERKTCWLRDSWPYLSPSTANLDHLYSRNFIPDSGKHWKKFQTWGDFPISISKSFQQCRSTDRWEVLGVPGSYLLLWHEQRPIRGFNGWLIQERTQMPKERFCTFILRPHEACTKPQTSLMCTVHLCLKAWLAALPFQTVSTCLQGKKEL